jgi:2-methylcitrate dehydratase
MTATASTTRGIAQALAVGVSDLAAGTDASGVALRLLDTFACAVGAERLAGSGIAAPSSGDPGRSDTPGSFAAIDGVIRLADDLGASTTGPAATIWATGARTGIEAAAMRNGVAARYLDFNDTYVAKAIVHPSDMIAMLVADAETNGRTWARLLEAITVAYEVLGRLADQAALRSRGFEASTLTPIAAAAGCAWLAQLSVDETANAINLACLDAATLRAVRLGRLSHWKAVASARGAVKGWYAVRATRAGLLAPQQAFDSPDGFTGRVTGPLEFDPEDLDRRLPRVLIKQYPLQIFIQHPVALASSLRAQADLDAIDEVVVRTFAEAVNLVGAEVRADLNAESADHSLRFGVAAMLVAGRLGPGDVHRLIDDPRVRDLATRVRVTEAPGHTAAFPRELGAEVDIRLRDGSHRVAAGSDAARLDETALATKLHGLTGTDTWTWPWRLAGDAPSCDLHALIGAQKGGNGVESH